MSDVSIVATAGQNVTLVDFTSDPGKMQQGIAVMQARPGAPGGHLLEGIDEAAKALGRREGRRKAIVVVSFGGEEFGDMPAESVLDRLRRNRRHASQPDADSDAVAAAQPPAARGCASGIGTGL